MNRTSYPYSHLFRGNRLYTNTKYFDAKAEEATLTKRYNKTYKSTTKDIQKLRSFLYTRDMVYKHKILLFRFGILILF